MRCDKLPIVMSLVRGKKGAKRAIFRPILICLLFALFAQSDPIGPVGQAQAQDNAAEILRLVNQFRAELGLPPLTYNAQLAAAAQVQANWLSSNGNNYVHTWPDGTTKENRARAAGYTGRVVENIVGGPNMTPRQGLIWWQNSPVHYNTLVTTNYTEVGTGYAFGSNQHRYVLVVGRPPSAPAINLPSGPEPEPLYIEPIVLAEPAEDGSITHTVGEGQAIWTMAAYYDVEVSDILLYNDLSENAFISPGDSIIIRPADDWVPPPTPTPPYRVTVQEGQTLWTIAAIHQLNLTDLLLYNGLPIDAFINPGDELVIRLRPGESPPPTPTPPQTYVIQTGDTQWGIVAQHGITIEELQSWNGISEETLLQPGTELRIAPPPPEGQAVPAPAQALDEAADGEADLTATVTPQSTVLVPTITLPAPLRVLTETPESGYPAESRSLSDAAAEAEAGTPSTQIAIANAGGNTTGANDQSGSSATLLNTETPFLTVGLLTLSLIAILFLFFGLYFILQSNHSLPADRSPQNEE